MEPAALSELTEIARLVEEDRDLADVLQRLAARATSLVPGCSAAGLTVSVPGGGRTAAVSDDRVTACHDVQFQDAGEGPARDCLRYDEPRRVDDMDREDRWPRFRTAARRHGFLSCLALPLRTDCFPPAALNLYAEQPDVFTPTTHDVPLLFAAQGGVALDNAALYLRSKELVGHLHRALSTRGVVERARGVLMGRHQLDSAAAFALMRAESQRSHRKLAEVAADLLDREGPGEDPSMPSWNPVRPR